MCVHLICVRLCPKRNVFTSISINIHTVPHTSVIYIYIYIYITHFLLHNIYIYCIYNICVIYLCRICHRKSCSALQLRRFLARTRRTWGRIASNRQTSWWFTSATWPGRWPPGSQAGSKTVQNHGMLVLVCLLHVPPSCSFYRCFRFMMVVYCCWITGWNMEGIRMIGRELQQPLTIIC